MSVITTEAEAILPGLEIHENAYRQLKHWLEVVYMTERIHQALDYATPVEFELAARANARYPLLSSA